MKQILIVLICLLTLPACSGTKESNGPLGSPSAFIGTIVGRWTTGCKETPNAAYQKMDIFFTATSGLSLEQFYKDAECTQISGSAGTPRTFDYTVKPKKELGEAVLLVNNGFKEEPMKVLLFDNSLTLTTLGHTISFTRVNERNK